MDSQHPDNGSGRSGLLDEAVVICLQDAEAGRPQLADWLAQHPHLAGELAEFLAGEAQVKDWAAPLRQVSPPADLPAVDGEDAEAPERIGGYEILREVGRGGMGVVYQARQEVTGKVVALKVIRPDRLRDLSPQERRTWVERFRLEVQCVAESKHPHIVPIQHVGEHQGLPFFTLEWAEGGTLGNHLTRLRQDPREAARLLMQVARAVHHAHQRGILHRDLKPGNILLDEQGEPLVSDFGLAKRLDQAGGQTRTGALLGTPPYMAPEQALGGQALTTAADVFSLGAILYECLTGQPPYGKGQTTLETLERMKQPIPPPTHLDPGADRNLENVCLRCLERDPAHRPSAEALADDLERYLKGGTISRPGASVMTRVKEGLRHREPAGAIITWPWIWACALVHLVTHSLVFWIVRTGQPAGLLWGALLAYYGGLAGLLYYLGTRQYAFLSRPEQQSQVLHAGGLLAQVILLGVFFLGSEPGSSVWILHWYPALTVVAGLTLFIHGLTHWGRLYLGGVAVMFLALPMRLFPNWAPLLCALGGAAVSGWAGWAMRRFALAYRQESIQGPALPETTAESPDSQARPGL